MKTGIIYAYTHKKTGRMYIGQTTNPEKRKKDHANGKIGHSYKFNAAMLKYGLDTFTYQVLMSDVPLDNLNKFERFYIKKFNSYKNGFNLTIGGDFDREMHNEPWFKERKAKAISNAWLKPGYKQKMSIILSKAQSRPEVKAKKSASQSNTMAIPEVKERHRRLVIETQRKPKEIIKRSRPVICVETGEWFISYQDAHNKYGVDTGSLTRVLQGKLKQTCGYHWRHATQEETQQNMEAINAQILENI